MDYSWTGTYEYDGTQFGGSITLNDTSEKNLVGKYGFTVASIHDDKYNLTTFTSNSLSCVWDRVKITEGGVSKQVSRVGDSETVWLKTIYEYDGEAFTGQKGVLYLNNKSMTWSSSDGCWKYSSVREDPGKIDFEVTGVKDNKYGLTVIDDKVGLQTIRWEKPFWETPISVLALGGVIAVLAAAVILILRKRL